VDEGNGRDGDCLEGRTDVEAATWRYLFATVGRRRGTALYCVAQPSEGTIGWLDDRSIDRRPAGAGRPSMSGVQPCRRFQTRQPPVHPPSLILLLLIVIIVIIIVVLIHFIHNSALAKPEQASEYTQDGPKK